LEEARVTGELNEGALASLVQMLGLEGFRDPVRGLMQVRKGMSERFGLDLVFRILLWGGQRVGGCFSRAEWVGELNLGKKSKLYGVLSAGENRSHPSELVSRHAGEIATKVEARREWLELSEQLCAEAPEGTIRKMGEFSRWLREGNVEEGEAGGGRNPGYEYR
jgi:hypothetical protein